MKVTAIKTFVCNAFRTNFVFVKVETDSGLYGWGEATLEYKEHTVEAAIHDLEGYLIGKDPRNIEAFRHDCYRDAYWRGGPVLMSALAGVEIALWDIKGKELNVPVYQLLGGKVRDAIPIYVNGWFSPAKTPDEFAEKAKILKKLKFPGCKWDPFGKAWLDSNHALKSAAMPCRTDPICSQGTSVFSESLLFPQIHPVSSQVRTNHLRKLESHRELCRQAVDRQEHSAPSP